MNAAIVDTDVVSILFKRDSRAEHYHDLVADRLLGISFMTLAELDRWTLDRRSNSGRKMDLSRYLMRYAVLPLSRELCFGWAEMTHAAKRKARPIQKADAWIAASALHYQVPLITNNACDYSAVDGLIVLTA